MLIIYNLSDHLQLKPLTPQQLYAATRQPVMSVKGLPHQAELTTMTTGRNAAWPSCPHPPDGHLPTAPQRRSKAEQIIDAAPYHNSQVVLSAYSAGRMELCPTQPRMINGNALCALRSVS